jgi:hypothetical protein
MWQSKISTKSREIDVDPCSFRKMFPTIRSNERSAFSQSPLLDSVLKFRNASTWDSTPDPRHPEEMD